jgi:hypothetical protein
MVPGVVPRLAGLALLAIGCGFFKQLAGSNTLDLEKAEVKSMAVDVRKPQKTICPREDVQMAIFAEIALEGEKQAKQFETWQGRGIWWPATRMTNFQTRS